MVKKRLTVELDEEIKMAAKVKAAKKGITLRTHVDRLIKKDLFETEENLFESGE